MWKILTDLFPSSAASLMCSFGPQTGHQLLGFNPKKTLPKTIMQLHHAGLLLITINSSVPALPVLIVHIKQRYHSHRILVQNIIQTTLIAFDALEQLYFPNSHSNSLSSETVFSRSKFHNLIISARNKTKYSTFLIPVFALFASLIKPLPKATLG